ncbi:hypothetical protein scyTo_0022475, partial [Scyliorhinus torazame]|nr:hypothetical protein [Scyliorhinus torazame]
MGRDPELATGNGPRSGARHWEWAGIRNSISGMGRDPELATGNEPRSGTHHGEWAEIRNSPP